MTWKHAAVQHCSLHLCLAAEIGKVGVAWAGQPSNDSNLHQHKERAPAGM